MKKSYPILLAAVMTGTSLGAGAVTPQMRQQASRCLGSSELILSWNRTDGAVAAFNRPGGGFAITAADGSLVGYSDSGAFDIVSAPAALVEILGNAHPAETPRARQLTPVEPLLDKIAWDQNDPYNLLCPVYYGSQRSATGCAATAMAQIMRFHNYPAHGQGKHSYTPDNASLGTLEVDFSQSEYDWANMTPTYGEWSTEPQRQAVARLMYDAGVAISMNYGSQSGAMSQDWPDALVRYFDYDAGVTMLQRAYLDAETYNNAIYADIAAGRPVFATGFTSAGGHAFVFDGYDAEGLVHVNWGWSGMSNGYFSTSWLTPSTQGTGGSDGGFNSRQFVITGIQPPVGENLASVILVSEEGLAATPSRVDKGTPARIKLPGKIYNYGWQWSATFVTALSIVDADGVEKLRGEFTTEPITLDNGKSVTTLTFPDLDMSGLADGEYRVYALARPVEGIRVERIQDRDLDFPNYLIATVADGSVRFTTPGMSELTATAPVVKGKIYSNSRALVTATLTNAGETSYHGAVAAALLDPATGKSVAKGDEFVKDVAPGQSLDIELASMLNAAPGTYNLVIVDRSGHTVSAAAPVEVLGAESGDPVAVKGADFGDNEHVNPLDVSAVATITAEEGKVFSGYLYLYIYVADSDEVAGSLGPVFVQTDDTGDTPVTFAGRFENGRPGHSYDARLVNGEAFTYVSPKDVARTRFTIDDNVSIAAPGADVTQDPVAYYSIDGRRLNAVPAKGLYIEISNGKATKKIAR